MKQVMLGTETTAAIKWPSCYLRCGYDFSKGVPTEYYRRQSKTHREDSLEVFVQV
jgi:hypothetical protein